MNVFFTSDQHFFHENIIKYCNRPFKTAKEMNETMVENWNSVVKKNDRVYVLGDFIFLHDVVVIREFISKLNGQIHLIYGSHDKVLRRDESFFAKTKTFIPEGNLLETTICGQRISLCHYPMDSWASSHYGAWQLFGHHHGRLKEADETIEMFGIKLSPLKFDVGVDKWNFTPVSFEQVKAKMATKKFTPIERRSEARSE